MVGQDNLPPAVYHTLVEEVNKALPTLHRYFRLRARMLGIEQMHYYDIYPRHDPLRGRLVGSRPEHHGAETDGRDQESALAELAGVHECRSKLLVLKRNIKSAALIQRCKPYTIHIEFLQMFF